MNQICKEKFLEALTTISARGIENSTDLDKYNALCHVLKEIYSEKWQNTNKSYRESKSKQVYYFSMEFLTGKFLERNIRNLDLFEVISETMEDLNIDIQKLIDLEKDQGLGNGGLGRLSACFLGSLSSMSYPGHGNGIRFSNGLFEQRILDGYQVEFPDRWLLNNNNWEIKRAGKSKLIKFGGYVEGYMDQGILKFAHKDYEIVKAVPYDTPVLGYQNETVNTLRLWSAEDYNVDNNIPLSQFHFNHHNKKPSAQIISQFLYPNDTYDEGKILRLKQEYFFVSAGIQSIIDSYKKLDVSLSHIDQYVAIHINDTHPAVAIPEFMRILLDEENMSWDEAWSITTKVMAYTNHTIMSEALEKWDTHIFKNLLPRIYMIIEEINNRFKDELRVVYKYSDENKINEMAIINDNYVKMAHLAIVGSHSINGVAKIHTQILMNRELNDFYKIYPQKFNNKTNGITHRTWLLDSNKSLSTLIEDTIGDGFKKNPEALRDLLKFKSDEDFQKKILSVKYENKVELAKYIKDTLDITVNPYSIFDVHTKRIHEYKRQLLNVLHIIDLYNRLLENPNLDIVPRTFIFAGKSAPSYDMAKQTIKLINTLADIVNNDFSIKGKIKVVFLANYSVTLASKIIPAADISEQISTASKEASGTGNMKFMMNGAITLATLDGANVEIKNSVGDDNIIIFGLTADQVYEYYKNGNYNSKLVYENNPDLKAALDTLISGFMRVPQDEFKMIYDKLLYQNDEFFILEDFKAYKEAQEKINHLYRDQKKWSEMTITNIACSGIFSADYTIEKYSSEIWKLSKTYLD